MGVLTFTNHSGNIKVRQVISLLSLSSSTCEGTIVYVVRILSIRHIWHSSQTDSLSFLLAPRTHPINFDFPLDGRGRLRVRPHSPVPDRIIKYSGRGNVLDLNDRFRDVLQSNSIRATLRRFCRSVDREVLAYPRTCLSPSGRPRAEPTHRLGTPSGPCVSLLRNRSGSVLRTTPRIVSRSTSTTPSGFVR